MALQSPSKITLNERPVKHCIFKWYIENFSLCRREDTSTFMSPFFKLHSTSSKVWYLQLNPCKNTIKGEGLCIYLVRYIKGNREKHKIVMNVKFTLEYDQSDFHFEQKSLTVFGETSVFGFNNICTLDELLLTSYNSKEQNDVLKITCEILVGNTLKVGSGLKCDNSDLCRLSRDIENLLKHYSFNDVIFQIHGGKVKCNKTILAARSENFLKMFEVEDANPLIINLPEIEADVIRHLLIYLYNGDITYLLKNGSIPIGLYECAKRFGVPDLEKLLIPSEITARTQIRLCDQCEYTWIIENVNFCDENGEDFIQSPSFGSNFGNARWWLSLYKRKDATPFNYISIRIESMYFHNNFSLQISLLDENREPHYVVTRKFEEDFLGCCEFPFFLDRKYLKLDDPKIFFRNTLIVNCKLKLSSGEQYSTVESNIMSECVNHTQGQEKLSYDLRNLYESGHFSDLILETKDKKEFKVHKIILCARYRTFKLTLSNNSKTVLKIDNLESDILDDFLKYIYSGYLCEMSRDDMLEVQQALRSSLFKTSTISIKEKE